MAKQDFKTQAEELCKSVDPSIREQAVTLATAIYAMQAKIDKTIPEVADMDLAQVVVTGAGETMLRQNPEIQEFRALVKDYANSLKSLDDILSKNRTPATISALDTMRDKVKAISL